jgi:hypothetical protein
MLDIFVPKVAQRPRIMPGIRKGEATGVPQHVRVCLEA